MQFLEASPDSSLVDLIRLGNEKAFLTIYNRYALILYIYACKICKDPILAEDIIQEVLISLWDKRKQMHLNATLSAYLYAAVRYKFLDLLDKEKIRSDYLVEFKYLIDEGRNTIEEYINEKELKELVEKEVGRLPQKMQEVFMLSRDQGMSHKEIAELLSISEKTIKNQITNAIKILRKRMNNSSFLCLMFF